MEQYEINQLLKKLNELEAEINQRKKYGLAWDKDKNQEEVIQFQNKNIPFLNQNELSILKDDGINHILIEGDNYHALSALLMAGVIDFDIIYIDPPYNTGNADFVYNDKFVGEDDGYRHSKWLSFMEKRLRLAREIMSDEGVIFISIDEHELFQLKLLCDSIFGEHNYIENFIWIKNSIKNLSKTTSTNHEYILCYAKNLTVVSQLNYFRIEKPGLDEVRKILKEAKNKKISSEDTEKLLRKFYKENPKLKGISMYRNVEIDNDGNYRAFRLSDISAPISKGALNTYEVIHPITKKPVKLPSTGWRYSKDTMNKHIKNNLVYFNKNESYVPAFKRYLDNVETEVCKSTFENFDEGKKDLAAVFNSNNIFDNPKPVSLIKYLIQMINKKDAKVMDFFAGSGTTGEAVLKLNEEDGGKRQFYMCTNNENNICRDITYQRVKTVLTGKRVDSTTYSEGMKGNLIYFTVDFIADQKNTDQIKYILAEKCNGLLCLLEDCYILQKSTNNWFHYVNGSKNLFIYNDFYSKKSFDELKDYINKINGEKCLYVFSTDDNTDSIDASDLNNVVIKPIPSKIYEIFKDLTEQVKRGE